MRKVLSVMTSGLKRDGITSSQIEYLKHMDTTGLEIDIASINSPEKDVVDEFRNLGCNVIQLPNRLKNPFRYIYRLNKLIKSKKYDVIHVHGSSALMAIELIVAKHNHVSKRIAHSRNTTCNYRFLDKLLRNAFDSSYTCALACGHDAGEWLFRKKDFTILHNGKDLKSFAYDPELRKKMRNYFHLGTDTAIGFVGSLSFQKNLPFILEFFISLHKKHPKSHLFLIGEGEERDKIERFISDNHLDDCITLTGRISNVNEVLQAMDIMILPSRYEGLPNVVLEWQISGLPSIISDKITKECAVTDLVYFEPIDNGVCPWIERFNEILKNGSDRMVCSQRAIERMKEQKFDIEEAAAFLRQVYLNDETENENIKFEKLGQKWESLRIKLRNKVFLPAGSRFRRKKLTNQDFTIISNNCWGGTIYESYNIEKKSPTVGMFIMPEDYLKLISNLRYYLSLEPIFIPKEKSKWESLLSRKKNWGTYLIARLGDIELHMLHYHDEKTAVEKWKRRVDRINWERIIVKFNDQNGCTQNQIRRFWKTPIQNKLCFVSRRSFKIGNSILIKQPGFYTNGIGASYEPYGKNAYIDLTDYINKL